MIQQKAKVLWNRPVAGGCWHLGLACDQGYEGAVPGQFVMIQTGVTNVPLLRRPFSIFGLIGNQDHPEGIEILYKTVGQGTEQMTRFESKHLVDVLGPLGQGYAWQEGADHVYFAAGGIGVAPLRFLAMHLKARGLDSRHWQLFLGGRTLQELWCRDDFEQIGMTTTITTDDGSAGDQCLITDPLAAAVRNQKPDLIFACGPHAMLKCVAGIAQHHQIPCQISMETVMACGIGACLGCAVTDAQQPEHYLHVCLDGPVFDVGRVAL